MHIIVRHRYKCKQILFRVKFYHFLFNVDDYTIEFHFDFILKNKKKIFFFSKSSESDDSLEEFKALERACMNNDCDKSEFDLERKNTIDNDETM